MAHNPFALFKLNEISLHGIVVPNLVALALLSPFMIFGAALFSPTPMQYADAQSQGEMGTVLVKYEDTTFEIAAIFTNGRVVNATVFPEDRQLLLDLEPSETEDGQLVLTLPRALIDARSAELSADEQFTIVFSESEAIFEEINSTDTARTLSIDIPVGTEYLTIIGTQVVPEFGSVALTIMGGTVVWLVVWARRAFRLEYNKT
jgi:hypothetical protein